MVTMSQLLLFPNIYLYVQRRVEFCVMWLARLSVFPSDACSCWWNGPSKRERGLLFPHYGESCCMWYEEQITKSEKSERSGYMFRFRNHDYDMEAIQLESIHPHHLFVC